MKERPIIFSAPMVRAILEGRKTMTRRVFAPERITWPREGFYETHARRGGELVTTGFGPFHPESWLNYCPYGQPGDRLWVREGWQDVHPLQVTEGRYSQQGRAGIPGPPKVTYHTIYRADGDYPRIHFDHPDGTHVAGWPYRSVCTGESCTRRHVHPEESYHGWASPRFMPRWASRITLEVTGVRVERLQDITPAQILAEGVQIPATPEGQALIDISTKHGPAHFLPKLRSASTDDLLHAHWAALWVQINGIDSWSANPWVWVVEFKRLEQAHG